MLKVTVFDPRFSTDQWNQCLNGVQWDRPTTLFPTCVAMGATWNPPLVKHYAVNNVETDRQKLNAEAPNAGCASTGCPISATPWWKAGRAA